MTKLIHLTASLIAIAVTVAPTSVLAAGAPAGTPVNGLSINAIGEVTYDSNQLRIPDGGALTPLEKHKDDFRYSPALSAEYLRAVGRTILTVDALIGRDFYQYNTNLNRNRFSGGGTLAYHAASCTAIINGNYSQRQNGINNFGNAVPVLPAQGDLPPDDVGRLIDNQQEAASYGINANCGSSGGRLSFGGGAQHSELSNKSIARRFADSNSDSYSLFTGLGVFRPGQLQLTGSYSTIGYPNRLATPGLTPPPLGFNTGVRTYRVGLSYVRPIGTKLTGTIGASYLTARPTGGQSPYSSPAYDISLSYHPGNRFSFALLGSRNIVSATTAGALYRVVDLIDLTGSYQIGESISAHANAGFTSNSYKQSFATIGQPPRGVDTTKIFGLGLSYAPRPLYDVSFFVSQTVRNARPSIFNYSSTKASITLAIHV